MKLVKNIVFAAILSLTVAHTPCVNAGAWDNLKHFAATAPLKHPLAFTILPTACTITNQDQPIGFKFASIITLASLYALSKQSTINPLWAYAIAPTCIGLQVGQISYKHTRNPQTKKLSLATPSIERAICVGLVYAGIGLTLGNTLFNGLGLGLAYASSKILG